MSLHPAKRRKNASETASLSASLSETQNGISTEYTPDQTYDHTKHPQGKSEDNIGTYVEQKHDEIGEIKTPPNPSTSQTVNFGQTSRKKVVSKRKKSSRKLFDQKSHHLETKLEQACQVMPKVVQNLDKAELWYDFMLLLQGIGNGTFPILNIAFLLLLEVARWYANGTTTQMVYWKQTLTRNY